MLQKIDRKFNGDIPQFIEENNFNMNYGVFKVKSFIVKLYYWSGILLSLTGIIVLFICIIAFKGWSEKYIGHRILASEYVGLFFSQYVFYPPVGLILPTDFGCLICGLVSLCIVAPQAHHQRLIVCDEGLLVIKKRHIHYRPWKDIKICRRPGIYLVYDIFYPEGRRTKKIPISFEYENYKRLFILIQRKVGNKQRLF